MAASKPKVSASMPMHLKQMTNSMLKLHASMHGGASAPKKSGKRKK